MSKYDTLKEGLGEDTFVGEKSVEQYTDAILTDDGMTFIQGFPSCPECGKTLIRKFLQEVWYCSGCETEWSRASLVEALQNERALAELCEEETSE